MLYEELDDRFGRRKKRTVIFGMAGGTPTPPTPPTPSVLEEKDLNFYDFEGTLVASYGADEIAGLTELPEAPDHSADEVPLTFEEWNWTLAEIKENHADMPDAKIIVGATYHPTDGNLHFIVETSVDGYLHSFMISFNQGAEIDWGDGTSSSVSGSSDVSHYYEKKGRYNVAITTTSTYFQFYSSTEHLVPKEAYISRSITDLNIAFRNIPILEKVVIPSSVATLGTSSSTGAFRKCYSLGAIILPRSLTEVGAYSMDNCISLKVLSLPPTITTIRKGAIDYCYFLKNLTMPKGLLKIGDSCQYGGAREISLPSSLTSLGGSNFYNNKKLRKINIPASVRTLGPQVFYSCEVLEQVELREGLESIGDSAFMEAVSLQTLVIPSTVTSIGNSAWNLAYSLASVTVLATTPPTLGTNAFYGRGIKKIYVPAESVEAYKSATNWANYAEKIEAIPA